MTKPRVQRRKISLDGCWAKIERAKEHRDALDEYIRKTFSVNDNCPAVGFKFDTKTGEDVLYISRLPRTSRIERRVGVLLGDTFHDLPLRLGSSDVATGALEHQWANTLSQKSAVSHL